MENILSLKTALSDKWLDEQRKRIDPRALFAIDYTNIARHRGPAANGDSADAISYGPIAEVQMTRLCEAFGFEELPRNWAEFRGLIDYCQMLQGLLLGSRTGPLAEDVRRHGLKVVKRYFPNDYEAAVAFFDDDTERLRQLHRADQTLARLGREFREFPPGE